jgi:hypothetical protein
LSRDVPLIFYLLLLSNALPWVHYLKGVKVSWFGQMSASFAVVDYRVVLVVSICFDRIKYYAFHPLHLLVLCLYLAV